MIKMAITATLATSSINLWRMGKSKREEAAKIRMKVIRPMIRSFDLALSQKKERRKLIKIAMINISTKGVN